MSPKTPSKARGSLPKAHATDRIQEKPPARALKGRRGLGNSGFKVEGLGIFHVESLRFRKFRGEGLGV